MKKRFLALTLSFVVGLTTVGCGSNENKNENETTQTSEQNEEPKEFLNYFPEKLELSSTKLTRIYDKVSGNGDYMTFVITSGHNDENTYMCFEIEDAFEYKMLTQGPNNYSYLDMYSALKGMLTPSDLEDMKEEYAEEKGLDVSKITDEEIDKVFREQTLLYGYTDLSLDGVESDYDMSFDKDSIEAVKKSYIDEGKLNTLLSSYDKTTLEYDSTENGVVKAFYNVEGFESSIVVGVDESTKELVSLSFVYEDNGMTYDIEITLSDFTLDNIDTTWATKETDKSSEEVSESMMMALMMITMGQIESEGNLYPEF